MKQTILHSFCVILLTLLACHQASAKPQLPNILFILADDLGYGDLSFQNPVAKIPTPHLDRLAAEGLRFTDAHSPSTVCTPSRYSLLTGRMAFRTGNRSVFTGAGGPNMIEADRLTLPAMLKQQGYATGLIGKWHVGLTFLDHRGNPICDNSLEAIHRIDASRPIPDSPIHRGFDQFFGTACCPTTDWLYAFIERDRMPKPPTQRLDRSRYPKNPYTEDIREGGIAPDFDLVEIDEIFLDRSLKFLENHRKSQPERPFFLLHSTQAVHSPSLPAGKFQGKTQAGPHGDFIHQLDAHVGTLRAKLDELGIAQNTLVMVSSDNGPEVWTVHHMRKDHQHDGARPWRGVKRDQWEGGHRVPFLVKWPDRIQAGRVSHQTFCLTDVMATCAAITGFSLPHEAAEDSFDFSAEFYGQHGEHPVRPYTLHQTWTLDLAIRKGDWKYLDHTGSGGNDYAKRPELKSYALPETAAGAPAQLYHLGHDPGETTNLYFEKPDIVREMKSLLEVAKKNGRSAPARN